MINSLVRRLPVFFFLIPSANLVMFRTTFRRPQRVQSVRSRCCQLLLHQWLAVDEQATASQLLPECSPSSASDRLLQCPVVLFKLAYTLRV